jgi:hypothetical protein
VSLRDSDSKVLLPCEDPDGEEIGLAECRYIEMYHGQKRCEGCPLNDKDVEIAAEIAVEHHCNVEDEAEDEGCPGCEYENDCHLQCEDFTGGC